MDETIEIDIDRLHKDLLEHFGTMLVLVESPTSPISQYFWEGCLGDIDTMYELGNYQGLIDLALGEGFELADYEVT